MNKTLTLLSIALLGLAGCATYKPTQAPPCFDPAKLTGYEVEAPNRVRVQTGEEIRKPNGKLVSDTRKYWLVHLEGNCPVEGATNLVFTDEMQLKHWGNQPWRDGYGTMKGWPDNGTHADRNSYHMRVCDNQLSWLHPFERGPKPRLGEFTKAGCKVNRVEPLWH